MISGSENKAYFARTDRKVAKKSPYVAEKLEQSMELGSSIPDRNISGFFR
jgi:hypothetical protein